jgi:hypothetical protein
MASSDDVRQADPRTLAALERDVRETIERCVP